MKDEFDFYQKSKNWNFSNKEAKTQSYTTWSFREELKKSITSNSVVLDLGTGGGENLLKSFPAAKKIIGTDFSPEMIKTANKNLSISGRKDVTFQVMDNLNMTTPNNYFDVVVARNTVTDMVQIYGTLKSGGKLILRGVDKLDCWELKRFFGSGQAYNDITPLSHRDYEAAINAGFKNVLLIPILKVEHYKNLSALAAFLERTPILGYNAKINMQKLAHYYDEVGPYLIRHYYGIVAIK